MRYLGIGLLAILLVGCQFADKKSTLVEPQDPCLGKRGTKWTAANNDSSEFFPAEDTLGVFGKNASVLARYSHTIPSYDRNSDSRILLEMDGDSAIVDVLQGDHGSSIFWYLGKYLESGYKVSLVRSGDRVSLYPEYPGSCEDTIVGNGGPYFKHTLFSQDKNGWGFFEEERDGGISSRTYFDKFHSGSGAAIHLAFNDECKVEKAVASFPDSYRTEFYVRGEIVFIRARLDSCVFEDSTMKKFENSRAHCDSQYYSLLDAFFKHEETLINRECEWQQFPPMP